MRWSSTDLGTRVLSDLDEKTHQLVELCMGNTEFIKPLYNVPSNTSPEIGVAYRVRFVCARAFRQETIGKY